MTGSWPELSCRGVAVLGLLLVCPAWAILLILAFSAVTFTGRAAREDQALAERFGEAWLDFKKRTKFLVPFIY